MSLTLGPIARPTLTERRAPAAAPESFDPRPAPNGRSATTPSPERSDPAATAASSTVAAHPVRRSTPQGGPGPVGCECCGRLATADNHLQRSAGPPPSAASTSAADRVAERYLRNAPDRSGGRADDTPRSVIT